MSIMSAFLVPNGGQCQCDDVNNVSLVVLTTTNIEFLLLFHLGFATTFSAPAAA